MSVPPYRQLQLYGTGQGSFPLLVLFLLFFPICAAGAPITFNTALPVAKGETVSRIQSWIIRATDDGSSLRRELTVAAFPVVAAYGISARLALFGIAAFVRKNLEVDTPAGRTSRESSGITDTTLLARYTLWKMDLAGQTVRLAPFLGLEAPTGRHDDKDDWGRLPQPLQAGSGSWDGLMGCVATWQTLAWQIDSSISYKVNGAADHFRFGDVLRADVSYQVRLWPRTLDTGVPAFIYGVLESNWSWAGKNRVSGRSDPNSGGVSWYLTPGIQRVSRRMMLETAVQIPVVQNLNGQGLGIDFALIFSVRVNF